MTVFVLFSRIDPPGQPAGAAELAYQLRGGPVFAAGGDIFEPRREDGAIRVPSVRKQHVIFADLAMLVDNADIYEMAISSGAPLIIDVHFPFGGLPDDVLVIQPGTTDETRDPFLDAAAVDIWSQPERINRALCILAAASVITSPRKDWAELIDGRSTPVIVLPDVTDPKSGARFFRRFAVAGAAALGAGRLGALSARVASLALSRTIRKRLANSGVDWTARKGGVL